MGGNNRAKGTKGLLVDKNSTIYISLPTLKIRKAPCIRCLELGIYIKPQYVNIYGVEVIKY